MKTIGKIIENSIVVIAGVVVLFFVAMIFLPKFDYNLIFIKSGSMEPTIQTGGAVIIKNQNNYKEGNIITFTKGQNSMVTHRITKISDDENSIIYTTKGDNNDAEDVNPVHRNDIKGSVVLIMPYIGYVIAFFKSRIGITLIIAILAIYLISREVLKIKKELNSKDKS